MSDALDNQRWSSALIEALALGGVREVVVSPGSRNTPLVLAWAARADVRTHVVLDERAAAFFALGLARASGAAVALVCTSGSAMAHYLPAVIEAFRTRVPLLLMTADRPPELQGVGAPQTIEQVGLFGSHVRLAINLSAPRAGASARWLRTQAARALDAALGSPAGPVHLNLPFRKPLWDASLAPQHPGHGFARLVRTSARLDEAELQWLLERVEAAERGVIVCGPYWPRGGAQGAQRFAQSVSALAARLGWPVIAEPTSQLRFGAASGHVIAGADAMLRDARLSEALAPDLMLLLGQAPTSKSIGQWVARHGAERAVVVDPDGIWHDPTHSADAMVVAEPWWLCDALASRVKPRGDSPWRAAWRSADEVCGDALTAACQRDDACWEGPIARLVAEVMPEGSALHVASSMPIRDLDTFARPLTSAVAVFSSRGANGIDGTVATALGESSAWSSGPTALLIGDMAFLHDAGGLLTVPGRLTVVVVNNDGGGIFGILPISKHPTAFERFFVTPQRADLAALCAAASARHQRVESLVDLREALVAELGRPASSARVESDVSVIEVLVDRDDNLARHQDAWARVSSALNARWVDVGATPRRGEVGDG